MEINKEDIIAACKTVYDPEVPVDIYELGLIYDIDIRESEIFVKMTLTAPNCPIADDVVEQVRLACLAVDGVTKAVVELVFEPAWTPDRMSDEAKLMLNMF